jgi:hypothetical protein
MDLEEFTRGLGPATDLQDFNSDQLRTKLTENTSKVNKLLL